MKKADLGPKNEGEEEIFAIEYFRIQIQCFINKLLRQQNMTYKQLADKLKLSEKSLHNHISKNMSIDLLARIFHIFNVAPILQENLDK